jgi:hypothetical protein
MLDTLAEEDPPWNWFLSLPLPPLEAWRILWAMYWLCRATSGVEDCDGSMGCCGGLGMF